MSRGGILDIYENDFAWQKHMGNRLCTDCSIKFYIEYLTASSMSYN